MSIDTNREWNPGAYDRFRDLRLRPALDLLSALPPLGPGAIVDLGCGSGAVGPALARLGRPLIGVDHAPAMLDRARATGVYDSLVEADLAEWSPPSPPALIFSNAALNWVPDHGALLPRLAGLLPPGGVLAVQVPGQEEAPSHRMWRELAARHHPRLLEGRRLPGIAAPGEYHRWLAPLGTLDLWETVYHQWLPAADDGHPVRLFSEATYARPILAALDPGAAEALRRAYDAAIEAHYPRTSTGGVLLPFRRLFMTLRRPG